MTEPGKFVNFSIVNDGDEAIPCHKTIHLRQPLLDNPKGSETVAITKLRIPTSELELLRLTDTSNMFVSFAEPTTAPGTYTRAQVQMYPRAEYPIKSIHDFKENINLSLLRCYRDWMALVDPSAQVTTTATNLVFKTGVATAQTIAVSMPGYTQMCHVSLKITQASTPSTSGAKNTSPLEITLTSPAGTEVMVSSGCLWDLPLVDTDGTIVQDVTFEDHSPNEHPSGAVTKTKSYRTLGGASVLNDDAPDGNWILTLDHMFGAPDMDMLLDVELTITAVAGTRCNIAPTISFSNTSGYLSINYPESFQWSNTMLGFSPHLNTILRFDATRFNDEYILKFDHSVFSAAKDELITRQMEQPSIEMMTNLVSILITSSHLLTSGELNDDDTVSHTIASFSPDFSNELATLHYDASSAPYRQYKLLRAGQELSTLDIGVSLLYASGEVIQLELAPHSKFFCTLMITDHHGHVSQRPLHSDTRPFLGAPRH